MTPGNCLPLTDSEQKPELTALLDCRGPDPSASSHFQIWLPLVGRTLYLGSEGEACLVAGFPTAPRDVPHPGLGCPRAAHMRRSVSQMGTGRPLWRAQQIKLAGFPWWSSAQGTRV